jgi:hypothetical protein
MKLQTFFLINAILAIGHGLGFHFAAVVLADALPGAGVARGRIDGAVVWRAVAVRRSRHLVRTRTQWTSTWGDCCRGGRDVSGRRDCHGEGTRRRDLWSDGLARACYLRTAHSGIPPLSASAHIFSFSPSHASPEGLGAGARVTGCIAYRWKRLLVPLGQSRCRSQDYKHLTDSDIAEHTLFPKSVPTIGHG